MPGQRIDRTSDNLFLEKVKIARVQKKDLTGNFCAIQVDFGHNHTQEAISRNIPGGFDVGFHSEVRAIAICINQELAREDTHVIGEKIVLGSDGDQIAKQVEIFFTKNPVCLVVGYSDRQPCKEPSFAANKPYQGCEKFLQKILPGDRHKIDYSFPYKEERKQGGYRPYTQYIYDNDAINTAFRKEQQTLQTGPKITYLKFTSATTSVATGSSSTISPELVRKYEAAVVAATAALTAAAIAAAQSVSEHSNDLSGSSTPEVIPGPAASVNTAGNSDEEPPKAKPKPSPMGSHNHGSGHT